MKKWTSLILIAGLTGLAMPSMAQNRGTQLEPVVSEAETVQAKVESINQQKQTLTLKDPEGNTIRMKFGKAAPELSELKKGDIVTASYYRSAAVSLTKPGMTPTGVEVSQFTIEPTKSSEPGGVVVDSIRTAAKVVDIDAKDREVTVKEADGKTVKLKVDPRVKNLDQIKKGDDIVVRYTEAAAISVRK